MNRIISLDVFRGMTIILMTLVNNPGDWGYVYAPFKHAAWNGYTLTDLVFPFFIFIVGITTVLSTPKKNLNPPTFLKISLRSLRIFNLGLFLNFLPFIQVEGHVWPSLFLKLILIALATILFLSVYDKRLQLATAIGFFILALVSAYCFDYFSEVRILGVLQRIALVYFAGCLCYNAFKTPQLIGLCIAILLGYFVVMRFVPIPGEPVNLMAPGKNLSAYIDGLILKGHVWSHTKPWDPEGILSTLPGIATALLGVVAGTMIKNRGLQTVIFFVFLGICCLGLGYLFDGFFPINKSIWSSSFALITAGWAFIVLALLLLCIDVLGIKAWTPPFLAFGVNPMVVFFYSGVIPDLVSSIRFSSGGLQTNAYEWLYAGFSGWFADPFHASLSWACAYILLWYAALYYFYKKKIIVKV